MVLLANSLLFKLFAISVCVKCIYLNKNPCVFWHTFTLFVCFNVWHFLWVIFLQSLLRSVSILLLVDIANVTVRDTFHKQHYLINARSATIKREWTTGKSLSSSLSGGMWLLGFRLESWLISRCTLKRLTGVFEHTCFLGVEGLLVPVESVEMIIEKNV